MKTNGIIIGIIFSLICEIGVSQNIGINTTGATPNVKALLDIDATGLSPKTGLLIPRLTTAERNAITSPIPESLLIYNTTTQCFEAWNNTTSTWVSFGCIGCQLPGSFSATAATGITTTAFDANWTASAGATTYYLDVATDVGFTLFVTGYSNLNVGNVTAYSVNTNLICATTYYYRVRANNTCGTSSNSNTISQTTSICCAPGDIDNGNGTCTATFYPDADPEATTVDGMSSRDVISSQSWSNIRGGVGTGAWPSLVGDEWPGTLVAVRTDWNCPFWRQIVRSFFLFNTAALPDGAIINGATLSLYGSTKNKIGTWAPKMDVNIYSSNPASNTDIIASDYNIAGWGTIPFSTAIGYDAFNALVWPSIGGGYNDFIFNANGIAAISKTGVSKFGARSANYDVANVEPSPCQNDAMDYLSCYFAEKGAGYKPKLVVIYTP